MDMGEIAVKTKVESLIYRWKPKLWSWVRLLKDRKKGPRAAF